MRLFSYVITHDTGFAPNPFGKYCTLATCKPQIRLHASRGDWVVGVGSPRNVGNGKLVYAMQVREMLSLEEYDADPRFQYKKPAPQGNAVQQSGDNIYYKGKNERWKQRVSQHTKKNMKRDLSGENVIVSRRFYYFGKNAVPIPARFTALVCRGRGHRCNFPTKLVEQFVKWLSRKPNSRRLGCPSNCPSAVHAPHSSVRKQSCGSGRSSRQKQTAKG